MNRKRIALVAHDNKKKDLIEWAEWNWHVLAEHDLVCTGTTGSLIEEVLTNKASGSGASINLKKLKSGPLGGDQQLGALIAEGNIDLMIFLWDPMEPQPHDVDVKALLRICVLYNIPTACNRATADYLISSSLLHQEYKPTQSDFTSYAKRKIPQM